MAYSKYRNVPTHVGGLRFPSKGEAARYSELRLLQHGGAIRDLERQVPYRCVVNGLLVCTYVADFRYFDKQAGAVVVEDFKGAETPMFKLKALLVRALFGFEILKTGRRKKTLQRVARPR